MESMTAREMVALPVPVIGAVQLLRLAPEQRVKDEDSFHQVVKSGDPPNVEAVNESEAPSSTGLRVAMIGFNLIGLKTDTGAVVDLLNPVESFTEAVIE
jgi:hypothetical protein